MSAAAASPKVFTIPAGAPFLALLARGLIARFGADDPLRLARALVLVPTRRAARTLARVMLEEAKSDALLLPAIRPIGDIDDDELALGGEEEDVLPPAIAPFERLMTLARLVRAKDASLAPAQAAKLAASLARFLDECQTAGVDPKRIKDVVPEAFARHWQETVSFLEIVTRQWPEILAERGLCDPAERRDRALRLQAERWRKAPPDFPVVAAGSTASIPASAELIALIATLPQGAVVLPGLDQELEEAAWEGAGPEHAQYGMKLLLDRMGLGRDEVAVWPEAKAFAGRARAKLLSEALRPAETTQAWRERIAGLPPEAARGIAVLEADSPREEAAAIALALREAIEEAGKTAMLVSADRTLARRVASELRRFGITADDSGGRPLAKTAPGTLLLLAAEAAAREFAPVPLLAALKHPLACGGMARASFREQARRLEGKHLRGLRPKPGLDGLRERAADEESRIFVERLAGIFAALCDLAKGSAALPALARAHIACAERLAADESGRPDALWRGETGEAACDFMSELAALNDGEAMTLGDYVALTRALMEARTVRPGRDAHRRLKILGPLEARLQHADLVVVGGLNEGSFPPAVDADPWASRPMRERMGLEQPERRIGLSAHDFQTLAANPEVLLTRAKKAEGSPATPSRFLVRLKTLLAGAGLAAREGGHYAEWAKALDTGTAAPREIRPPAPAPPVAARPRKLSATSIEKWVRDPYAIYARYVLKLKPLDPVDMEPDAKTRGILFHEILEEFFRRHPAALPADALSVIAEIARAKFAPLAGHPGVMGLWWPRFLRAAEWLLGEERKRREKVRRVHAEIRGALKLETEGGDFLLTAKADRIDELESGEVEILDFKTGTVPSGRQIASGLAPQLPLEALIARDGGFGALGKRAVRAYAHVKLSGGRVAGEFRESGEDLDAIVAKTQAGLSKRIAQFGRETTPYLSRVHVRLTTEEGDYDHLARTAEWSGRVADD